MDRVRIDKWLWAARFFKTRAQAATACDLGRVQSGGQHAKPSREVRVGDLLKIKNVTGEYEIEVLIASDMRGSASVAQTYYRESEASRDLRLKLAEERKANAIAFEVWPQGRPSKRDRREIDRFRGR